ncbi:type VII secretion integral membrane protein EccD [Dactylosporangium vinaceum]|uniref:Type VII secretion integral membrane protein EccD n=1 Tax=Dactylosporangium vinaceum TaxID=53362 RepID=A0ABV5MN61_9ACTN|nr:type VII secretion integral membrane protein EccD [Dactylosporangium vinaceum]UAB97722.1 type VII secretion integral membrane protein EccD [Dactylosporangium vinaceum]
MADNVGAGLARVVLAAPKRRLDLALPEQIPLAMLLPGVLPRAGESLADDGLDHGGWVLRRTDGSTLDMSRTLAAQNVHDGDILHLAPRYEEWPELEYDDVVDAIAAGARRHGAAWTPAATRITGLATGLLLLFGVLALLFVAGPAWTVPGAVALVVAAGLLTAGFVMSRAMSDASAGSTLGAAGLVYAFAGGLLVLGGSEPLARLGAPHLLTGAGALLVAALAGYLAVAAGLRLFVAGIVIGAVGVPAGLLGLTSLGGPECAACVVGLLILLAPALPLASVRMGKVPVPQLPRTTDDLLQQDPIPPAATTYATVARADEIFTGLLFAFAVLNVASFWLISREPGVAAGILIAVVAAANLLRARLFSTVRHRLPLLLTGLAGLLLLTARLAGAGLPVQVGVGAGLLLTAGLAVAAGMRYAARPPSVQLGRLADILDVLLVLATIPIVCQVLGLYAWVRGLAG